MRSINNRNVSTLVLSALFATSISAHQPESYLQIGQRLAKTAGAFIAEKPVHAAMAFVVTVAVGTMTYLAFKSRAPQAANAAVPLAAAVHLAGHAANQGGAHRPPAPHQPHQGGQHFGSEQEMIQMAMRRSLAEAAPFQALGLSAAEYAMSIEIFSVFQSLQSDEERVEYLMRVLYNHDHVFMERDALLAFVLQARDLSVPDLVSAFHKLTAKKWSLLSLASEAGAIDPEEVPTPDFENLRADYQQVRRILLAGGPVDAAYRILLARRRHAVEDAILRLVVRRLYVPQGLDARDLQRVEFALTNIFGEGAVPQAPSAPPAEVAAVAASAPPVPAQLTPEELREARLKRLDKKE